MPLMEAPHFIIVPYPSVQKSPRKEQKKLSLLNEPRTSRFRNSMVNMRFSSPVSKDLFSRSGKARGSESPLARKADNVELIRSISQAGWQSKPSKAPQIPMVALPEAIVLENSPSTGLLAEDTTAINGLGIQMGNTIEVEVVKIDEKNGSCVVYEREGTVVVTSTVHVQTEDSNQDNPVVEVPDRNPSRKLRPRISVTIPENRSLSFRRVRRGDSQHYEKETGPSRSVSPASVPASRSLGQSPAFQLEVVSPVSVEMPTPQRYSAPISLMLPGMRLTPDPEDRAPSSASSTGNVDDDASCYSARSSMSSFHMEQALERKASPARSEVVEFMIMSPTDAGVFDDASPYPKPRTLRRSKLTLSLLNKKPLPPEPMPEVAPLLVGGKPCSRNTSVNASHNRSVSDPCQPVSPISPIPFSSHLLLQSFTPVDLDTLDEAFRRSSPLFFNSAKIEAPEPSPTLQEVAGALEVQLSTISEAPPVSWDDVSLEDPLQISRGLMHMVPTRPAPPPPVASAPATPRSDKPRNRIRSKETNHVATQIKASGIGSSSKETFSPILSLGKKLSNACRKTEPTPEPVTVLPPESAHMQSTESLGSSTASNSSKSEASIFTQSSTQETVRTERTSVELQATPPKLSADEIAIQEEEADQVTPLRENLSKVRRYRSQDLLAASDVPAISSTQPSQEAQEIMDQEELDRIISAEAAEKVIFNIMNHLDTLGDLFSCAHLNRGFYRTFKRNELTLIKNALFKMSPAAWELREVFPPYEQGGEDSDAPLPEYTPTTYLRHYSRDLCAMVALKSLILHHCSSFLRAETVSALSGSDEVRSSRIDDAFWRVWTFCRIFGCGKGREEDIVGQMDWLKGGVLAYQQSTEASMIFTDDFGLNSVLFNPPNGFAKGNGKGLSIDELYDMTEIWTCLGALLRGFHGMRSEAREIGIFANTGITEGDINSEDAMLEEWTYHLLTLSPSVIFTLASSFPFPSPNPNLATFALAKAQNLGSWPAPATACTRRLFLKEAVTRVYESKFLASPTAFLRSPTALSPSDPNVHGQDRLLYSATKGYEQHRRRHTSLLAAELRRIKHQRSRSTPNSAATLNTTSSRPFSTSPEVGSPPPPTRAAPPPPQPRTTPNPPPYSANSYPTPRTHIRRKPQVTDPVDKALHTLVSEMGFSDSDAKRALAETDRGDVLDLNAAIEVLVAEKERREKPRRSSMLKRTSGVSERWCTKKSPCERWA